MPRTTERAQALLEIDTEIEDTAYTYVFASSISSGEEDDYEEDLKDVFDMRDYISSLNSIYLVMRA